MIDLDLHTIAEQVGTYKYIASLLYHLHSKLLYHVKIIRARLLGIHKMLHQETHTAYKITTYLLQPLSHACHADYLGLQRQHLLMASKVHDFSYV